MVFLSNYGRSNFLSYFLFSDLITDCVWIEGERVIDAIKIIKQSYLQQVFIHLQS